MANKVEISRDGPQPPTHRYLKSKDPEVHRKIREVISWLRKGNSRKKCVEKLMDKYDYSVHQARKYVHDAFVDIYDASTVADNSELKEVYIDRIEEMLTTALESKNLISATRLMDMLNKITGMYVEKQEVDVKIKDMQFKFGNE